MIAQNTLGLALQKSELEKIKKKNLLSNGMFSRNRFVMVWFLNFSRDGLLNGSHKQFQGNNNLRISCFVLWFVNFNKCINFCGFIPKQVIVISNSTESGLKKKEPGKLYHSLCSCIAAYSSCIWTKLTAGSCVAFILPFPSG